ncbi:hypothetical protein FRACA_10150 [Frankia canadensis]|uniref:Uncharacterized protein n=1 Tax=Frankia canadensis TaxID=1836972 RepID=A0A2I2KIA1_9ACTN|nr:hypothetical protein FRACA_10150 [Frankia canadensis]SOU52681.1 hypothetical protein FRACA_10150 [Frankia canadensis]
MPVALELLSVFHPVDSPGPDGPSDGHPGAALLRSALTVERL